MTFYFQKHWIWVQKDKKVHVTLCWTPIECDLFFMIPNSRGLYKNIMSNNDKSNNIIRSSTFFNYNSIGDNKINNNGKSKGEKTSKNFFFLQEALKLHQLRIYSKVRV